MVMRWWNARLSLAQLLDAPPGRRRGPMLATLTHEPGSFPDAQQLLRGLESPAGAAGGTAACTAACTAAYLHHSAVHQGADGAGTQPGPQPLEEAHLPIDPDDVLGCTRGKPHFILWKCTCTCTCIQS